MEKRLLVLFLSVFVSLSARAQFADCSTGLLSAPSAEMNPSGTVSITNLFLNKHLTTDVGTYGWNYNTFQYGFGITFWSRLEVGYVCTIFNGDWNPDAVTDRQKRMKNQDRHFVAKALLLKEGQFDKEWMPSLAVGVSDPTTAVNGDYLDHDVRASGNGYFNRYYLVATKHFKTKYGEFAGHLGYQFNKRIDYRINCVCAGVSWRPVWLENRWFNPLFIAEFDSRTPNVGFVADIWDGRFKAMFELQNFQWVSFGIRFNFCLSGSEK